MVIKYKVEKSFIDKNTKETVFVDSIIDIDINRMKELNAKNIGRVIDVIEDKQEVENEKLLTNDEKEEVVASDEVEEKEPDTEGIKNQEEKYIDKVSNVIYQGEEVYLFELSEKEILDLLSKNHSLSFDDFINAKRSVMESIYQKCILSLSEKSSEKQFVLVGVNTTDEEHFEDIKPIIESFIRKKGLNENELGYALLGIDILSFIQIRGYGIPIHTIIHEANHLLSRSSLIFNPSTNLNIVSSGISYNASKDLIYEMINDLMADEIEEIFMRKFKECKLEFCSYIFPPSSAPKSIYPILDNICNHVVLDFYSSEKDLIKDSIIRGEGRKIYKIIGNKFYDEINSKYQCVIDAMRKNPGSPILLDDKFSQKFNSYKTLLKECFQNYYQYEEQMKQYRKNF